MDLRNLAEGCMGCRICGDLSAHVTWPVLGIFPPSAKILLIGQNPAEPKYGAERTEFKVQFEDHFDSTDPIDYLKWYEEWFAKSTMVSELANFLGDGWFESGDFAVTNAVRCRTKNNTKPSDHMMHNCKKFTEPMMNDYKYWIIMGTLARNQLHYNSSLKAGMVLHYPDDERYLLFINHYAWYPKEGSRNEEMKIAKRFVRLARNPSEPRGKGKVRAGALS